MSRVRCDIPPVVALPALEEPEAVEDDSQGVPLALMQDLARCWAEQAQLLSEDVRATFRSLR